MTGPITPIPEPIGHWGWLTRWPDEITAASWAEFARRQPWPVAVEIVPAYRTVAAIRIETPFSAMARPPALELLHAAVVDSLTRFASQGRDDASAPSAASVIEVPVVYDGPDLEEVAARLELAPEAVVDLHTSNVYLVFAVGFLPGFPYAGYLPEKLTGLPRRGSPRTKVPAGSVAIVGRQTGIYPCESPGGWHILGRTPLEICDLKRGFFRFRPADRIRFVAAPGGILPRRVVEVVPESNPAENGQ